ncbi:MAG: BrnT family toxin [Gammaproteobacteria bacterium]
MPITFEWDEAKNAVNIARRGLDFDEAIAIFDGAVVERIDQRRDYGEIRIVAIGLANDGVELTVIYTMRGDSRRIISARRSHRHERRTYRQAYPKQS